MCWLPLPGEVKAVQDHDCPKCGESFHQQAELLAHRKTHEQKVLLICLGVHLRAHTGERPFMCPSCRKSLKNKTYLVVHQRVHTHVRAHACAECSKSFLQKQDLMVHQCVHSKESPFPCSVCGRRFYYKSSLAIHQRTHTGERPFPCSNCSQHFKYKTNLLIHQHMHTGERPYPCPQCSKSFTCSTNLLMHQITHDRQQEGPRGPPAARRRERERAHTADQPFVCAECGKGFEKHGFLIIHQRSHCPAPAGASAEQAAGPGKAPCSPPELAQSRQLGQGKPRAPLHSQPSLSAGSGLEHRAPRERLTMGYASHRLGMPAACSTAGWCDWTQPLPEPWALCPRLTLVCSEINRSPHPGLPGFVC
ncbi:uncharacterized protein LOC142046284 [Chelonoidis abingdonii]|uniref:uncharacterized protein LOC142046284 n=1 Tax=Chelonoidis abingdonii TaxID=106734 RepID=UPI003F4966A7